MTNAARKASAPAPKGSRGWTISLIALSAVFVLGVSGTVFYGSVVLPAQNKAADLQACKIFEKGYASARMAFVKEATSKQHTPSLATAIDNYINPLFAANHKAYKVANPSGDLSSALSDLAVSRLSYESTKDSKNPVFPNTVDQAAMAVEQLCTPIIGATKTATPTASPTATK
jgi:hypothetical protein